MSWSSVHRSQHLWQVPQGGLQVVGPIRQEAAKPNQNRGREHAAGDPAITELESRCRAKTTVGGVLSSTAVERLEVGRTTN